VRDVAAALQAMGCDEISLGDTIGTGTPGKTQQLLRAVTEAIPAAELAGHFHDTYGQALANVYAAMELGIATFDSSVAGLGGCPYAKGATGNVASEDVLYLLNGLDIETGVDMTRLRLAGRFICDFLGRRPASRVARALDAKEPLAMASPIADSASVASPCNSVCIVDPVSGLCGGCFRTLQEIAGWIDFSNAEKRSVIAALDARRETFGAAIARRLEDRAER
jgi:predicted Fe-S protein YdhL (DUF1289 family)